MDEINEISESKIPIEWKQYISSLTEMTQFKTEDLRKLGITFPESQIKNQMKENGDLTPWKRFRYIFCPVLKRLARIRAMADIERKKEEYMNGTVHLDRTWWPFMFFMWKAGTPSASAYKKIMEKQRKEKINADNFKKEYFLDPPWSCPEERKA